MTKGAIFLATGGTGGHIFPAEALSAALLDPDLGIIPVGVGSRCFRVKYRNTH